MSNSSTFCRLSASSKQKVSWLVLFALLFIQVKVAVAGCLISDVLPPPQPAEQLMQMTAGEPCTEHGSPGRQLCSEHCAQNSDAPKFTFDLPTFAPAILSSNVPLFFVADTASSEISEHPIATAGPPPYLRFLRLLN
jgi:hypothetical protein